VTNSPCDRLAIWQTGGKQRKISEERFKGVFAMGRGSLLSQGFSMVGTSTVLLLLGLGSVAQANPPSPDSVPFEENAGDAVVPQPESPATPSGNPPTDDLEITPNAETRPNPDITPNPDSAPVDAESVPANPSGVGTEPALPAERQTINLRLPDLLNLTLQGNRTLRDRTLERIIQRQQLTAAEQTFDPRLTPTLRVDVNQNLSATGADGLGDATDIDEQALLTTEVDTRLGTNIRVGVDPLDDTSPFQLAIRQPLMRGFGQAVNEAPVDQARLQESQNQLDLRGTVIDTLTEAINRYTNLIRAQSEVEIQAQALERRQRQLEIQRALVAAGRQARVDLFNIERSVADAERDLVVARNRLQQANNDILNLIGTDRQLSFSASTETITALYESAVARAATYEQANLVQLALGQRPDYLKAQLNRRSLELAQLIAEDNLRWSLDAVADGNLGDFSQSRVGLVATRTFDDPDLQTARVSSDVNLERQDNRLLQLEEQIRNDVTSGLADVQSNLLRVQAAERATLNARRQLDAAKEQFRLGRGDVSLFQIIDQEENLVTAENNELAARIDFLNSVAQLEQTVGITLETWDEQLDLQPLLNDMGG
jgi:outer membrane protein